MQQLEPKIALAITPTLVADLNRIGFSSLPRNLTVVGDIAFFAADAPSADPSAITSELALWKTDGTEAGTVRVSPAGLDLRYSYGTELVAIGSTVFFVADDGVSGRELWKTDGTQSGTQLVADIEEGDSSSNPSSLTAAGSTLYFSAYSSRWDWGFELWKTDGTTEGTVRVSTHPEGYLDDVEAVGQSLFFMTRGNENELWRSNGTEESTELLAVFPSGYGFTSMTAVGGTLFFTADDGETGTELWKTDGTADGTVLVKDIRPGTTYRYSGTEIPASSNPSSLTAVGPTLFFRANDGETGHELWKTDGTADGTVRVKDIWEGAITDYNGDEIPASSYVYHLTVVGSTLFFTADDGETGSELWKSDGSPEGTVRVADLKTGLITDDEGSEFPASSSPGSLTNAGGQLFFFANGKQLWKSDGSEAGTTKVATIGDADDDSGGSGSYGAMAVLGGSLLFSANDGEHGAELWKSEIATGATTLVKDIDPRNEGSFRSGSYGSSAAYGAGAIFNGMLYFAADDGKSGLELWRTDGTAGGTVLVKDIAEGRGWNESYTFGPLSSSPSNFTVAGDTLFFTASQPDTGVALWKTDGTTAGTVLVAARRTVAVRVKNFTQDAVEVAVATSDPTDFRTLYPQQVSQFVVSQGTFEVNDGVEVYNFETGTARTVYIELTENGPELSRSRFSIEEPNSANNGPGFPSDLTAIGSTLYFIGDDGSGRRVWKTDGDTTSLVAGTADLVVSRLTARETTLFFVGYDEDSGFSSLYQFEANTGVLSRSDFASGPAAPDTVIAAPDKIFLAIPGAIVRDSFSSVHNVTAAGDTAYFAAYDGLAGWELWKSDGTASGTQMVKDIVVGWGSSFPAQITAVGSTLFFTVYSEGGDRVELWKTDGTNTGTVRVSPTGFHSTAKLTAVGNKLYFVANDGASGQELWQSDGTIEGTTLVADIFPGSVIDSSGVTVPNSSYPAELTVVGSVLFFRAFHPEYGESIWRTDGSEAGTVRVSPAGLDVRASYSQSKLTALGNALFFVADDGETGWELWRTDGTAEGATLVSDIFPGGSSRPYHLTAVGSTLFFQAFQPGLGTELWKTDGTPSGTQLVKDIVAGNEGSYPLHFTEVGSTVVFSAFHPDFGNELWRTDGTATGTLLVKDVLPGGGLEGSPTRFVAAGSSLFFLAAGSAGSFDGIDPWNLWKTDGSAEGTYLIKAGIAEYPNYGDFTAVGSALFFVPSTGEDEGLLWKTDGTVQGTMPITADGEFLPGMGDMYWDSESRVTGLYAIAGPAAGVDGDHQLIRSFQHLGLSASYGASAVLDGMLYFAADDGESGMELWKTNGTAEGTVLVADLYAGAYEYDGLYGSYSWPYGSSPRGLLVVGDLLYFMADDSDGPSLWQTDGTPGGTAKVVVPHAGARVSALLGGTQQQLFVVADDGSVGPELWKVSFNAAPTGVSLTPASLSVAENMNTAARVKVADLAIADDAQGTNAVSLVGADAGSFEVSGAALYLKAGVALNFEAKQTYAVTVSVADLTVVGSAAVTAGFTLTVTDVPEAAVISLPTPFANTVTEDAGVDASGFLVTGGTFGLVDPDAGQAVFKTTVGVPAGVKNLGSLTIGAGGAFTYRVLNALDAVQALRAGQTRSDVFTIESLDGTKLDVTFSIAGVADALRGVVADGYLAGATVFADTNGNRVLDAGELFTTTDNAGNFLFDFGSLTATLISIGGTDISTGLPFAGSLTAPAGSTVINPLTTVVTAAVEASLGGAAPADAAALATAVAAATSKVVAGLGLPTVNLTTFDPLAPTADQTVALAVQKVAAAVANVMVVANTVGADVRAVVRNVASAVTAAPSGATVNLADTSVLTQVLTAPAASGGSPAAPPAAAIVALTQSNLQISSAGNLGAIADLQTSVQSAGGFVDENAVASTIVYQAKAPAGMTGPAFSLKEVAGDDRSLLSIDASTGAVRLLSPANFEAKGAYRFTVVASQQGQATVETVVSVRVNDLNEAPTGLALTVTSVAENQPAGTVIGTLSASDQDAGDTLAFSLVPGDGSGDNGAFTIDGSQLKAASTFNFEVRNSYSVRIRVSDAKGLTTEVPVTISVVDVADEPLVVERVTAPAPAIFGAGQRVQFAVTLSEIVQVRGKPQIQVRAGGTTRTATYVSGSGSATLTFQYVVGKADVADVVSIGQKFVFAKKSAIVAGAEKLGAALPAGIAGFVADGVRIDAVPSSVIGKVRVPVGGTYRVGDSLDFIVRFSEAVIVSGAPQIGLTGLTSPRQATYVSGTGSTELTFRYVVRSGDAIRGKKGLGLAKSISLPGGASIGDEAGNRAVLKVSAPSLKTIRLDAAASTTEMAAPNKRSRAVAFATLG